MGMAGCASNPPGNGSGSTGGGSTITYPNSTGNWEMTATATKGVVPFSTIGGFINEQATGSSHPTTGAFMVQSTGCYAGIANIPMQGVIEGLRLHIVSFPLEGQTLDINGAKNTTSTQFTGSYTVTGGCGDGATGTITGTQYASLTGTYAGTFSGGQTISLTLSQFTLGTGDGVFLLGGSARLGGFTCFTSATMASSNGAVSGNTVVMNLAASADQNIVSSGTFDAAASKITLNSTQVTGGNCAGSLGAVTLSKQP